jgi:hypothetical protein
MSRMSTSPFRLGLTCSGVFSNPVNREYQSLASGERFTDLGLVPARHAFVMGKGARLHGDGGPAGHDRRLAARTRQSLLQGDRLPFSVFSERRSSDPRCAAAVPPGSRRGALWDRAQQAAGRKPAG